MRYPVALCKEYDPERVPKNGVLEEKYDGVIAQWDGPRGDLWSREGHRITHRYPDLIPYLPRDKVLLMEIVVLKQESWGWRSDFEKLQYRYGADNRDHIRLRSIGYPASAMVFDVMEVSGNAVTSLSLRERRAFLGKNLGDEKGRPRYVVVPQHSLTEWAAFQREIEEHNLEGMVIKDLDAPYVGERTFAMMKLKFWKSLTLPITGWEDTEGKHGNGGFVVTVKLPSGEPQRVACSDRALQERVRSGLKDITVTYLHVTRGGRLRKPHLR